MQATGNVTATDDVTGTGTVEGTDAEELDLNGKEKDGEEDDNLQWQHLVAVAFLLCWCQSAVVVEIHLAGDAVLIWS